MWGRGRINVVGGIKTIDERRRQACAGQAPGIAVGTSNLGLFVGRGASRLRPEHFMRGRGAPLASSNGTARPASMASRSDRDASPAHHRRGLETALGGKSPSGLKHRQRQRPADVAYFVTKAEWRRGIGAWEAWQRHLNSRHCTP